MAVMVAEAVTPGQARAFARRQERARDRLFRQEAAAVKRMRRLVSDLRRAITLEMAQTQSAFRLTGLARLQANLDAAIARFAVDAAGDLAERQRLAWDLGVGSVDDALRAVGMLPVLPAVGMEQLAVLSQYGTDLIGGLSQHARARVRPVLTQAAAGVISLRDAMQRIGGGIDRGAFRTVAARAEAIVRTEVLRSYSIAQDRRLRDAAGAGVKLRRRWVAALDGRTRPAHRAAHGQVRPLNRLFDVGGEKLRYPRDPRAGAANTIQCRCVVIPELAEEAPEPDMAERVRTRIAQGIHSDRDVIEVGTIVRQEVDRRLVDMVAKQQELELIHNRLWKEYIETDPFNKVVKQKARDAFRKAGRERNELINRSKDVRFQVVRDVLRQVRPLGGVTQQWATESSRAVRGAVRRAGEVIPRDWLRRSREQGMMRAVQSGKAGIGYYQHYLPVPELVLPGSGKSSLAAGHEMMHRMQQVVPRIREFERQFYLRRTKGETPVRLFNGDRGFGIEMTRPDRWATRYTGRILMDRNGKERIGWEGSEVLSTGFDSVLNPLSTKRDVEHEDFTMGVLVAL